METEELICLEHLPSPLDNLALYQIDEFSPLYDSFNSLTKTCFVDDFLMNVIVADFNSTWQLGRLKSNGLLACQALPDTHLGNVCFHRQLSRRELSVLVQNQMQGPIELTCSNIFISTLISNFGLIFDKSMQNFIIAFFGGIVVYIGPVPSFPYTQWFLQTPFISKCGYVVIESLVWPQTFLK